jgi:multidrug efflux pump subunit AcrB
LLVARILTPMMAAYLLKSKPAVEQQDGRIMRWYLHAVRWCMAHRKTTMLAATLFFVGSVALIPFISTGLMPPADRGYTTVNVELPPGSSLQNTLAVAERARTALGSVGGIDAIFTTVGVSQVVGGGQLQAGEVRNGSLTLSLADRAKRPRQTEIEKAVRRALLNVPGARFTVGAGGPGEKMQLILAGDNENALKATAQAMERQLRGVGSLANISSTASLERPEIIVRPDLQRASELGVSTAAIGQVVRIATAGDFSANLAKLNLDNRQVDINVSVPDVDRQNVTTFANLHVLGRNGLVPLSSVASLSVESGPSKIERYDRRRYVTVSADLGGMPLGEALAAAKALPAVKQMPSSVQLIQTGDAEIAAELGAGFMMAIVIGVLCVFCVLVLLFRDFLQPVTILSAIPLSLGGAFLALLMARSELDIPSMIGLVMLMGIVTKNSILLVEYAIVGKRDRGLSVFEALIDACHKRARPIVMTTVAMIAGMAPIALGFGADSSFRQPMAVAVIGGLLTSTALSLLVVPVVFTYVDEFEHWLKKLFSGKKEAQLKEAVGGGLL